MRHCGMQPSTKPHKMDKLCRIRDLQRAVMRFEADFEAHYGISLNEGMTLCSLSQCEKMCPGELGEALGLTPSNMSKVLRSVESKGLAVREMCCKDRRQFFYSVTAAGAPAARNARLPVARTPRSTAGVAQPRIRIRKADGADEEGQ